MALAAILGDGLVGTWLQLHHQKQAQREQRRERASDVLAAVKLLVDDLNPGEFAFTWNMDPRFYAAMDRVRLELLVRVRQELRERFAQATVAHPSQEISALMDDLDGAIGDALIEMDLLVSLRAAPDHPLVMLEMWREKVGKINACYRHVQELLSRVLVAY